MAKKRYKRPPTTKELLYRIRHSAVHGRLFQFKDDIEELKVHVACNHISHEQIARIEDAFRNNWPFHEQHLVLKYEAVVDKIMAEPENSK